MEVYAAPFLMAPMAGITDRPFRRRLCRNGAKGLWTEMVSAAAFYRNHKHTVEMIRPDEHLEATTAQLFGSSPLELGHCAKELGRMGYKRLDLNMGCPVKKVLKTGSGAALMRTPDLARRAFKAVRDSFDGVVTVKMRLGFTHDDMNFLDLSGSLMELGASGIILHARTRAQGYSGFADWTKIDELGGLFPGKIAGNGDVQSAADAVARLNDYPIAAVMIGRAALSAPWLFGQAHGLLAGQPEGSPPGPDEVAEDLSMQFADLMEEKGPNCAVAEMKKFVVWASKGVSDVCGFRTDTMLSRTPEDITLAIDTLKLLMLKDQRDAA